MDRLTSARVFVETVERGNASSAAKALGMSRAMASRYLSALEDWTGTRLLHRTTRRLSVTSAGERVLELSREIVRLASTMESVAQERESPQGMLRVAAPTIFTEEQLAPLIAEFLATHPRVSIDLRASDRAVDLVEDRIDVAIRIGAQVDPGVIARKLGECRSALYASPKYLTARGTPARPEDLESHECLTFTNFGASNWELQHRSGRTASVKATGRFRTNEAIALRRATLASLGIAMLPTFATRTLVKTKALQLVLKSWEPRPLPINALYLSRTHLPSAARAFIDYLAERLTRDGAR